jgi:hypothetical protein
VDQLLPDPAQRDLGIAAGLPQRQPQLVPDTKRAFLSSKWL